jgi:hypothetical protein
MPCEWIKDEKTGAIIHINRGRGGKKKTCPFCKRGSVSKLCDFPVGNGKTCDAEMCDQCATLRGHYTVDVCPIHKSQAFPEATL